MRMPSESCLDCVPRSMSNCCPYCATKAFLHSWLQSLRFQLRDTPVEVIELAPPYVQTELGGARQLIDPHAVPLGDYIAEVMDILSKPLPDSGEVLTDGARKVTAPAIWRTGSAPSTTRAST